MVLSAEQASGPAPTVRCTWMDLLRGTAVLLIVVWHAVAVPVQFEAWQPPAWVISINDVLSPYRVPLLLVLSGLLLPRGAAKGPGRFAVGKLSRILWPLVVWTLMIELVLGGFERLLQPGYWFDGMLWFLGALVVCYAVAWVRVLLEPMVRIPWIVFAALALGAMLWFGPTTSTLDRLLWASIFFFLGASMAVLLDTIQQRLPLAFVIALAVAAIAGAVPVARGDAFSRDLAVLTTSLCGVLVLLWLAPRIPENPIPRALQWYGRQSIVVYVGHPVAMYLLMAVLELTGLEFGAALPLVMLVVGVAAPTGLILVRGRTTWLYESPVGLGRLVAGSSMQHRVTGGEDCDDS